MSTQGAAVGLTYAFAPMLTVAANYTLNVQDRTNVQDGVVIHCDAGIPTIIGNDCVLGHRAVVHGSRLEDAVLVGMGAILLNGTYVGTGSIIGAGAVCTENTVIPPNSLVLGIPAKVVKTLGDDATERTRDNARRYVLLKERYRLGEVPRRGSPTTS